MTARTFILGVGAQKAGTTWLFHYLAGAPNASMGLVKEYHIWDALTLPLCGKFVVAPEHRGQGAQAELRFLMQKDTRNYFDYFAMLLQKPGKTTTADITPSYSGLAAPVLRQIVEGFASRAITARAVFLLRDPVERCWSQARMAQRRVAGAAPASGEEVLRISTSPESDLRTRYDRTLDALAAAFPQDAVYAGLHETMHLPENVAAISRFCGVESRPALAEDRVNTGEKQQALDPAVAAEIARHYRPVYDMAARRFPEAVTLWPGYRYL